MHTGPDLIAIDLFVQTRSRDRCVLSFIHYFAVITVVYYLLYRMFFAYTIIVIVHCPFSDYVFHCSLYFVYVYTEMDKQYLCSGTLCQLKNQVMLPVAGICV